MEKKYKVIYTGNLTQEASHDLAVEKIAKLFKISTEKAEEFISTDKSRIIKKDLSLKQAEKYKAAFGKIGLEIIVKEKKAKVAQPEQQIQSEAIPVEEPLPQTTKTKKRTNKKYAALITVVCAAMIIAAILLFPTIFQKKYSREDIVTKKGVWYDKKTDKPITGIVIFEYKDGQINARTPLKNGLKHGVFKAYHPGAGALMTEAEYVDGKAHGKFLNFDKSGYLIGEAYYVNGKKHGEHRRYRASTGTLEHLTVHDHGKYVLMESYHTDGEQLLQRIEFENGKQIRNLHYFRGNLSSESFSKDGHTLKDINYHDSGEVNSYTYYENGKKKLAEFFKKSGQLYLKVEYENGKEAHKYQFRDGILVTEIIMNNGKKEIIQHQRN